MIKDVYEECPIYKKELITLRKIKNEDAQELLKCYSDERAVPFFNSDNCDGDDFHYTTVERMNQAIDFWESSYKNRQFVRWTVILNSTGEKIGSVEMFHRTASDEFNDYGLLRIDLKSEYETKPVIENILAVSNEFFYSAFDVKSILTKGFKGSKERICALKNMGYEPINKKFMIYDDYYCRKSER